MIMNFKLKVKISSVILYKLPYLIILSEAHNICPYNMNKYVIVVLLSFNCKYGINFHNVPIRNIINLISHV